MLLRLAYIGRYESQRKFGRFPEGADERRSAFHATELWAGLGSEFKQVFGTEVGPGVLFQVAPEVFNRVEFRGVSGQLRQVDFSGMTLKEGLPLPASVHSQPVPDHQQGFLALPVQLAEEIGRRRTADCARMDAAVEVPPTAAGKDAELAPTEAEIELWGLPPRGPSANHRRSFAPSGLIDEDDGSAFGSGLFFTPATDASARAQAQPRPAGWRVSPASGHSNLGR